MPSIQLFAPFGDTIKACVHVVDADGNSIDLSVFEELTFTLLRSTQDDVSAAVFQGTETAGDISILSPSDDGVCEVIIPALSAVQMRIGRPYYWTLEITTQAELTFTAAYGTLLAASPIQK